MGYIGVDVIISTSTHYFGADTSKKFKKQENIKNSVLHIVICLSVREVIALRSVYNPIYKWQVKRRSLNLSLWVYDRISQFIS